MPEKVVLADGTEREVPTAEEFQSLSEKAAKIEELQTQFEATKKQLEEAENPNWRNLRNQVDSYKAKLAEKGFQLDTSGNIIEAPAPQITTEQVRQEAQQAARSFILEDHVSKSLEKIEPNSREIVRKQYNKLVAGENVDQSNFSSFMDAAMRAAGVDSGSRRSFSTSPIGGGEPKPVTVDQASVANAVSVLKSIGYQFKNDPTKITK